MIHVETFFAHPDDLDLWAGGTLSRHVADGDLVRSTLFYECNDVRLRELRNARRHIPIEETIRQAAAYQPVEVDEPLPTKVPDIVITHWSDDAHIEHRLVFDYALRFCHMAKRRLKTTPMLLMASTYHLRGVAGVFEPQILVDVTAVMQQKRDAIGCYGTQHPERLLADVESQNRLFGRRIGVEFAEGFIEYPLFGFTRSAARDSFRDLLRAR